MKHRKIARFIFAGIILILLAFIFVYFFCRDSTAGKYAIRFVASVRRKVEYTIERWNLASYATLEEIQLAEEKTYLGRVGEVGVFLLDEEHYSFLFAVKNPIGKWKLIDSCILSVTYPGLTFPQGSMWFIYGRWYFYSYCGDQLDSYDFEMKLEKNGQTVRDHRFICFLKVFST